tara:strand:+ start:180 stop:485 length:306 start_codon:yes stop_codon:yes gene_type:complete
LKYSLSPIDFKYVYNNAQSLLVKDILFYYIDNQNPQLGFIVSKKYGNSVQRNLFKRRCRYAFYKLIKNEFAYSIIIQPKIKNINWETINKAFELIYEKTTH